MAYEELKPRTKQFALKIIRFAETSRVLRRQLLRSGTSVGANYRAASRAKSKADFISKMGTVEEEADESAFWLELLLESGKVDRAVALPLHGEADELVAIAVASINTARKSATGRSDEATINSR